jgi:hypothetical protein
MRLIQAFTATCLLFGASSLWAQDANLKKTLAERLPSLPKIEEISKTPMAGVFEIRVQGNEIFYTDAKGDFLIQGALIDTKQKRNLTEERNDKLSAIPFDSLPLKYAFTQVKGNGKRKLAPTFKCYCLVVALICCYPILITLRVEKRIRPYDLFHSKPLFIILLTRYRLKPISSQLLLQRLVTKLTPCASMNTELVLV